MKWLLFDRPLAEDTKDPIEQVSYAIQGATRIVEEASNRAQQIPEQVAWPCLGGDVQDHLIEVNLQAEQIKIERSKLQVQDLTRARRRDGCRERPKHCPRVR